MVDHVPTAGDGWARADPGACGFDAERLAAAVAFAHSAETPWSRDIAQVLAEGHFEPPPWNEVLGPVAPRGGPSGLVIVGGRVVAEWGDTHRPDMTFSAAKSYLALCAGLIADDGALGDLDIPVGVSVTDGGFDGPHNGRITWRQLLQQTSEWEGTLWDKPDLVDRNRDLGREGGSYAEKGTHRTLAAPGAHWEYNDVRVNRLALALLRRAGRGLPDLLRERIMDPIGASPDWRWHGYRNSWVEIDGVPVQSVSGGAHWGGGLFISARDHARVGLLLARDGVWGDRRLLSSSWIAACLAPCPIKPTYGFLIWLNTGRAHLPSAPETSFFLQGAGSNLVWIDRVRDLVVVLRWIAKDKIDGFASLLMAAMGGPTRG
jgi:CubicO group peptidase (beta-lactamase class C family)